VVVAALFEPKVIVRADAGEQRQLITAQPWNTAAAEAGQPDVLGAQQLASGTKVLTERRAHHHGASTIRRPISGSLSLMVPGCVRVARCVFRGYQPTTLRPAGPAQLDRG
jgi:hypothetical protein